MAWIVEVLALNTSLSRPLQYCFSSLLRDYKHKWEHHLYLKHQSLLLAATMELFGSQILSFAALFLLSEFLI